MDGAYGTRRQTTLSVFSVRLLYCGKETCLFSEAEFDLLGLRD